MQSNNTLTLNKMDYKMDNNLNNNLNNLDNDVDNESNDQENAASRLPTLIRAIGAVALGIAMYTFLMKGWQQGDDLSRYLMMLAHTVILVGAGLLSGHWLHESKGARLLVMMALASIPANFAILGGFIFSQVQPDAVQDYPRYITWAMDSLPAALGVAALALAVLMPVAKLGFSVLARSLSTPLSALFIASNTVLLLPLRDAHWVSGIALLLAAATLFFNQKLHSRYTASKTYECMIAMTLLFLPLGVLLGRSVWLYHSSFFIAFSCVICTYGVLRRLSSALPEMHTMRGLLDTLAAIPALGISFVCSTFTNYSDAISQPVALPLGMMLSAAMLLDISHRATVGKTCYRVLSALIFSAYFFINLLTFDTLISAQLCLAGGVIMLYMGQAHQYRSVFIAGVIMVITGLIYNLLQVYHSFNLGGWVTLAGLGITLIILASWIETKGKTLKPYLANWKDSYLAWDY